MMFSPGLYESLSQQADLFFPFRTDQIFFPLSFQQHKLLHHPIQDVRIPTGQSDSFLNDSSIPIQHLPVCAQYIIIITALPFSPWQGKIEGLLNPSFVLRITQCQHRICIHQSANPAIRHPVGILRTIIFPLTSLIVSFINVLHHPVKDFTHRH